jgi:hypothetical protein
MGQMGEVGAAAVGLSGVGKCTARGLAVGCPNRARRQFITLGWSERRQCRAAETYFTAELARNQLQSHRILLRVQRPSPQLPPKTGL